MQCKDFRIAQSFIDTRLKVPTKTAFETMFLIQILEAIQGVWVFEWLDSEYGTVEVLALVFGYEARILGVFLIVYGVMKIRCRLVGDKRKVWWNEENWEEETNIEDVEKGEDGRSTPSTF